MIEIFEFLRELHKEIPLNSGSHNFTYNSELGKLQLNVRNEKDMSWWSFREITDEHLINYKDTVAYIKEVMGYKA